MEEKTQMILDALLDVDELDKIRIYNDYKRSNGDDEDLLFGMEQFSNVILRGRSYEDISDELDEDFDIDDEWFYYSYIIDCWKSTNDYTDLFSDEEIADIIEWSKKDYGIDAIRKVLKDF